MRTKVHSQLRRLWEKHGAHEFGKICQILLGFCLNRLHFRIKIFQLSGRPDIVAIRNKEKFAFEVKTQSGSEATIKPEDLNGVKEYPERAIIAVLSYPDLDSSWVLVRADEIKAGRWPIPFLKQHSIPSLEEELNAVFPEILEEYFSYAELGTKVLYDRFDEISNLGKERK
ncbi:MAG: hypothetical protein QXH42_10195 [Thermoplasmata archaeon]